MIPAGLRCCLGQRMVLLRPNPDRVLGRYLLFALQSSFVRGQIMWAEGTGSTVSNPSELAFYDALANNDSAVRELGDPVLKLIAQELTQKLRNSATVDWQKPDSVRARLRNLVRITLRRYKYPPDLQEQAIQLVLSQAERLADDWGT
jgi:hypothetical protein